MEGNATPHLLFTDGSALGNPGPGGWGAVMLLGGKWVVELGGRAERATNNEMELVALIKGLERMTSEAGDLTIYLDSAYVANGATRWGEGWKRRGWKTTAQTNVEHRHLWEKLFALLEERKNTGHVVWKMIPGHAGVAGNERADAIATAFAANECPGLFVGDLEDYAVNILNVTADTRKRDVRRAAKIRARASAYSYLSLVNGKVMRHATWAECERRVKGKSGAKYQKAVSAEDERAILRMWGKQGN